jgi:hypothetical protein
MRKASTKALLDLLERRRAATNQKYIRKGHGSKFCQLRRSPDMCGGDGRRLLQPPLNLLDTKEHGSLGRYEACRHHRRDIDNLVSM